MMSDDEDITVLKKSKPLFQFTDFTNQKKFQVFRRVNLLLAIIRYDDDIMKVFVRALV